MDFSRNRSRVERRRRVLMEESALDSAASTDESAGSRPVSKATTDEANAGVKSYPLTALVEGQPRIADLLPQRRLTLGIWAVCAIGAVAALTTLHLYATDRPTHFASIDLAAFDLTARGSLGRWYSSLVLAWASFAAVQVYLIRQHRSDDYGGSYRVWPWAAGMLGVASADVAVSLHTVCGELLAWSVSAPQRSELLGLALVAIVAGIVLGRMSWEMRVSRGAMAVLGCSAASYVICLLAQGNFAGLTLRATTTLGAVAAIAGHVLVLLAIGVYGRFVFWEAHAEVFESPNKPKPRKKSTTAKGKTSRKAAVPNKSATDQNATMRSAAPQAKGETTSTKQPAKPQAKSASENSAPSPSKAASRSEENESVSAKGGGSSITNGAEDGLSRKLSKAERRKRRKQQQERRAA